MVIGSSGRFQTRFLPDECGRRLNDDRSADSYVGFANSSGFELAKYGRTAVRIRGTFAPSGTGTSVDYRLEFIPWMLWALVLAFAASVPLLVGLVWLRYIPVLAVAWLLLFVPFMLGVNFWFSERQAKSLKEYIASVLEGTQWKLADAHGIPFA